MKLVEFAVPSGDGPTANERLVRLKLSNDDIVQDKVCARFMSDARGFNSEPFLLLAQEVRGGYSKIMLAVLVGVGISKLFLSC